MGTGQDCQASGLWVALRAAGRCACVLLQVTKARSNCRLPQQVLTHSALPAANLWPRTLPGSGKKAIGVFAVHSDPAQSSLHVPSFPPLPQVHRQGAAGCGAARGVG